MRHAVRCWDAERHAIVGAGGREFPRWVLDLDGVIVAVGDASRRVLIGWPTASVDGEAVAGGAAGLWVDVDHLEPAPRFRCTGRGSARQDACRFVTDSATAAARHFERCDHDVEAVA